MDTPNKAKVIANVSIQVPRFKADRIPMGKAKISTRVMDEIVRMIVSGRRCMIS